MMMIIKRKGVKNKWLEELGKGFEMIGKIATKAQNNKCKLI